MSYLLFSSSCEARPCGPFDCNEFTIINKNLFPYFALISANMYEVRWLQRWSESLLVVTIAAASLSANENLQQKGARDCTEKKGQLQFSKLEIDNIVWSDCMVIFLLRVISLIADVEVGSKIHRWGVIEAAWVRRFWWKYCKVSIVAGELTKPGVRIDAVTVHL